MKNNKSLEKANVISRVNAMFDKLQINSMVELVEVDLKKLRENKNSARLSGESTDTIKQMAKLIKDGQYNPYLYIPPVIELNDDGETYTIISGHHRFKAHKQCKVETMVCVSTSFITPYQRTVWRAFENSKESDSFVKNVSDEKNDVLLIVHAINNRVLPGTRESIERFIKDAKLARTSNKINVLVNNVLLKIGKVDSDFVMTYDKSDNIVESLREKYTDRNFVGQTFKGTVDVDYDARALNKFTDLFLENPTKPIELIYSVNDSTKDEVIEIRNYKANNLVDNYVKRCREVTRLHDEGYSLKNIVSLHPLPQLGREIEGDDKGKKKFYSTLDEKFTNKTITINPNVSKLIDQVKNCKDIKDAELAIKKFFTSTVEL
jgi:hypothetical protein